ncbi:SMI1/KNR4 family protein [Chamaesiphon sp.]|uniref:SMI1/KNR4 family protein n=1 Tax=Chamaesiphon sp. TaxID=2814140 RepID=UPI003593170A
MSKLLEEFAYIFEWMEYTVPNLADRYNPGLTRQQIDNLVKDLPFKLSEEVYELYQWRNGQADLGYYNGECIVDFLFPDHHIAGNLSIPFWSLQTAIQKCYYLWQMEESNSIDPPCEGFHLWERKWFPIASMEDKTLLIVIGDLDPSPVYQIDFIFSQNPLRVYKSLTSIISTIAECCESELYTVIPDEYNEMFVDIKLDEKRQETEKAIYKKYNS